jgi:hypothetical protein
MRCTARATCALFMPLTAGDFQEQLQTCCRIKAIAAAAVAERDLLPAAQLQQDERKRVDVSLAKGCHVVLPLLRWRQRQQQQQQQQQQ